MSETKINNFINLNKAVWLGISLVCLPAVCYLFVGRDWVIYILKGEITEWESSIINYFYPRFEVEAQRLSPSFFLKKADQLILRVYLLLIGLLAFFYFYFKTSLKKSIVSFWDKTSSAESTKNIIRLFYLALFLFSKDWFTFLIDYQAIDSLYKPISFYSLFHLPLLNITTLSILWGIYILSITGVVLWLRPVWCSIISSTLFIYLQGYLYSFEKVNHAFATLSYAAIIVPVLISEYQKAKATNNTTIMAWPIVLIKVSVGFAYLQSGLEKLLNSGFEWMHESTILVYDVSSSYTSYLFTYLVIVFQIGFIFFTWKSSWEWPPWQWLFITGGVIFHFSTVWFLSIGALLNPWIFLYIFWFLSLKNRS